MRCVLLFFLLGTLQTLANVTYSQSTKFSLNMESTTVQKVLSAIEQKSEFYFTYNLKQINANRVITLSVKEKTVVEVLDEIFVNEGVKYTINDKHIVLYKETNKKASLPGILLLKKITGTVVDYKGDPIAGANIVEKGSATNGTVTDMDGHFSISVPDKAIIVISYLGHVTQEIPVANKATLTITLIEDTEILDEVVVVGYGTQKKGQLATAVTNVKSEVLQNRPVMSIGEAIQGAVPGLSVVAASKPGDSPSINLRGATSINSSGSPLVLIDGVPGDFNFMNAEDIEAISVLKDAASSAIYGSRAANGVILVTTKRGKIGKPTFRYNGSIGINTPSALPKMCSSAVYARIINEAEKNMNRAPVWTDEDIALFESGADPNRYPNTDWIDLMLSNSMTTRHALEASGGTDVVKYLLSAGMDHQTGVYPQHAQNVFNIRSNTDVKISKKINLSFDLKYQVKNVTNPDVTNDTDDYRGLYAGLPTMIAYYTDGTLGYNAGFLVNPLDVFRTKKATYDTHDASAIFKFDYEIIDGLKFTGIANANFIFYNTSIRARKRFYTEYFTKKVYTYGNNWLEEGRDFTEYYNLQALLTYNKTLGKHSFDILGGYQQENQKYNEISASRSLYPTDAVWVLDAGPKDNWTNGGTANHWAIASFIGRLNYAYANKYMLSASFRSDASSRFSSGYRWATFPSVAFAWRISQESFMEGVTSSFLDDLKLRASWGQTGASTGLGLYPSYSTIGMNNVVLNDTYKQTAQLGTIGNPELGWERTEMLNFGLDLHLLDNRLSFTGDYYTKTTKDILLKLPVPLEYGFEDPYVNVGKMRNKGWELEVGWNDKIGNFSYQASFNISDNRNEVLDLGGTGPWKSGAYTAEGLPFDSLYGYESMGLFQSDEEVAKAPFQNANTAKGDVRYKDQNDDKVINSEDRVVIGDQYSHFLLGLRLGAEFKGFDLNMQFSGMGKRDFIITDPTIRPLKDTPIFEHQLDFWSEENKDAKYPRILNGLDADHNYMASDFWKINAGYLRLKNLQIGYSLPKKILHPSGFSWVRVYVSANNLFTVSDFIPGFDPELQSARKYPYAKTYSFGINVQF